MSDWLSAALADQHFCDQAYGDIGGCYDIGYGTDYADWIAQSKPDPDPLQEKVRQIERDRIARFYCAYLNGLPPHSKDADQLFEIL